jgi:hypothetical protein
MAVFWVVGPCRAIALMMEAARTSETLVNFYQTTRRYNPEDSHLRESKLYETGGNCIMRRFIIYTLHQIMLG